MSIKSTVFVLTAVLLGSCLDEYTQHSVTCTPTVSNDGKYINCIVAESDGTITMENGGYNKTTYQTTYWLKQYETATGKLTNKKKLLPSSTADNVDINFFGSMDDKIWLYVNGIRAYDMNSLEEITNEEKIAAENGMKKTAFPYGERMLYAAVEKGYIDFIADNKEQYRLQLKDFKIINKKEIKDAGTEKRKTGLHHEDDYGTQCDTLGSSVFAFAKNEAAANDARPGLYGLQESAYRIKLFKGSYALKPLGNHYSFSYQNITSLGNGNYLNPCFAVNTSSGNTVHLSNPDGFLLLQQDTLGEKLKAIISRIDSNGKTIWQTVTGASTKIADCIISGKYCIITTNKDYMLSPHTGKDVLYIVDTETGNIIKPRLEE